MRALIHFLLSVGLFGLIQAQSQTESMGQIKGAQATQKAEQSIQVILETTAGKIRLHLFPQAAPKAVENFVGLVDKGYYNGVIFHRVIRKFMIQGGDPTGTGRGGDSFFGEAFEDEIAKGYAFDKAGILAMANAGPNTNRSQFFITTTRTPHLNGLHTIFGEISAQDKESFQTLRKIEYTPTNSQDRPLKEQKIIKAYAIK